MAKENPKLKVNIVTLGSIPHLGSVKEGQIHGLIHTLSTLWNNELFDVHITNTNGKNLGEIIHYAAMVNAMETKRELKAICTTVLPPRKEHLQFLSYFSAEPDELQKTLGGWHRESVIVHHNHMKQAHNIALIIGGGETTKSEYEMAKEAGYTCIMTLPEWGGTGAELFEATVTAMPPHVRSIYRALNATGDAKKSLAEVISGIVIN